MRVFDFIIFLYLSFNFYCYIVRLTTSSNAHPKKPLKKPNKTLKNPLDWALKPVFWNPGEW